MNQPSRHIGRKIWYATAIALCGLVLLLSVAGIVGGWIITNKLSQATVTLLEVVKTSADGARQAAQLIDQGAVEVSQITSEVSQISLKISENVEDEGLVALLLPEDMEAQLKERIDKILNTLNSIRAVLASSRELYRSINSIPFVNLPGPSEEQITSFESAISEVQQGFNDLRQSVQDFRAGVSGQISRVTEAADKITAGMEAVSARMVELDANLVALQDFATQMQTTIPKVLTALAVLITLFLAYVIYTQVEVIRLYVVRWKSLKGPEPEQAVQVAPEETTPVV